MIGLPYGEKTVTIKSVKPFSSDTAALRTDRQTDRISREKKVTNLNENFRQNS